MPCRPAAHWAGSGQCTGGRGDSVLGRPCTRMLYRYADWQTREGMCGGIWQGRQGCFWGGLCASSHGHVACALPPRQGGRPFCMCDIAVPAILHMPGPNMARPFVLLCMQHSMAPHDSLVPNAATFHYQLLLPTLLHFIDFVPFLSGVFVPVCCGSSRGRAVIACTPTFYPFYVSFIVQIVVL